MSFLHKVLKRVLAIVIILILFTGITVSAEVPFESYTYWSDVSDGEKAVYNRPMYNTSKTFSAADIGVNEFEKINYVCTDTNNNIYILDSASRIVVLNNQFEVINEIGLIGGTEAYQNSSSIFIASDNTIYICDTKGNRVLHTSQNGELIEVIGLPDSPLIPTDFSFNPSRVILDDYGYLYVLSEGSYYGALLYDLDKTFLGFYGANTVSSSVSGVLTNIKNHLFPNNEKKANTAQKLPYSFVDIEIDNQGFIYTCNGYTSASERKGQIRKLSPGAGSNILGSQDINFVDYSVNSQYKNGAFSRQNILDIEVDSNGYIYGLESVFGKVFLYDTDCNILTVFGGGMGSGTQSGNFVLANSFTLLNDGETVIVSDYETNLITVFEITDFGRIVKELINITKKGEYDKAKNGWNEILKQDSNFQLAYSGLARVYLNEENYDLALKYAREGYDRDTYAVAFEYVRKDFIDKNFAWIFGGVVLLLGVVIAWIVISTKKNIVLIKNRELRLMLNTSIHPNNVFTDIKEKHYGSVLLSVMLVALYYVATVLQSLSGGFLFTLYDPTTFNSLFVLARSAGLVILWVIANWLVCTISGGKGKLKEIIVVTCYSLMPLIVEKFIRLILTNVLVPNEAGFLGILDAIAVIYFVILLVIGLLKIHDFSLSGLIGTSALSLVGIAAIVFLLIMFIVLVQQLWGFILTVATEVISL